jgi:hypothetical protein
VVLVAAGWQVISRHWVRRLPGQATQAHRIRIQSGARHLQADAGLLPVAPIVGLLWVVLDGGGVSTWARADQQSGSISYTVDR